MTMMSFRAVADKLERLLPERQIYHRTSGQVKYWAITTHQQLAAIGLAALIVGWFFISMLLMGFGKTSWLPGNADLSKLKAEQERHILAAQASEREAREMLAQQQQEFAEIADSVIMKQNTLAALLDSPEVPVTLTAMAADGQGDRIMMSSVEREVVPRASRTTLDASLTVMPGNDPVSKLRALDASNTELLFQAELQAQADIESYRSIIRQTGLPVTDMIDMTTSEMGGPLIEIGDMYASTDPEFAQTAERVAARMSEAEALEALVKSTPLAAPVASVRTTSSFGRRVDPFTKKPAYHSGLDFGGATNMPILATAPGIVSFAGWRDGYGRCVEIDHGNGIKTRYAHLRTISVKRGAEVAEGDTLGGMGSSGRSTSTHLHYEIWYQGRPVDPLNFIKAGQNVQ